MPEIAPIGTPIEDVHATDADFGPNAEIKYRISKGAYDDFAIEPESGKIYLSGTLDYDRRDSYRYPKLNNLDNFENGRSTTLSVNLGQTHFGFTYVLACKGGL